MEALITSSGEVLTENVLTENDQIEQELFDTFFRARHTEENLDKFDKLFFEETNKLYGQQRHSSMLYSSPTLAYILTRTRSEIG